MPVTGLASVLCLSSIDGSLVCGRLGKTSPASRNQSWSKRREKLRTGPRARRYPGRKEENWWLVVGEPEANALLAIKRVALQRRQRAKLEFAAPAAPGLHRLTLYFMCDSYLGCDQARARRLPPPACVILRV
jgi:hypothetical protein